MAKYRMNSLAGPFVPGRIVTDDEIKKAGGDLEFWKGHGAVTEVTEEEAKVSEEPFTDGALKAEIERRVREESGKRAGLTADDHAKIAADVSQAVLEENAKRIERHAKAGTAKPKPAPASAVQVKK